MVKRIISLGLLAVIWGGMIQPASAQASETGGKKQTLEQVLGTIVLTVMTLQGLKLFKIP